VRVQAQDVELGYFAHPDAGPSPSLVMIHDVWGLSAHARDLACRFAREGFGVLALDLYRAKGEYEITNPGEWMRSLSDPEALRDVQAGIDFLALARPTRARRTGVVGFCMGGMYALLAACQCRGLSAAVPFYGLLSHQHGILHAPEGLDRRLKPVEPLAAAPDLHCPLLALFGDQDEFIPLADIEQLRQRLAEADAAAEVVVYPGAGHAFMNDTRPAAFRPEIAKQAWARSIAFLKGTLVQKFS
jgi:carboxymethylenebutenolidase